MSANDTYRSIASSSRGQYRDLGSRFIAFAYPVESEEDVKEKLSALRREYHDARHHCYAYRLGLEGELWRANDDGEPSGSAGRQILSQIDSAALKDVLVVVVRYFGGIKLGIPGLVRAYKTAAAEALSAAEVVTKTAGRWLRLSFPYSLLPPVMKLLKDGSFPQRGQAFGGEECSLETFVRLSLMEDFLEQTKNLGIFISS